MVVVAILLSTIPSFALKVKLSSPFQSVVGTYVTIPSFKVAVPLLTLLSME